MAKLDKATYGEGSMKGVGLVVSVYDNAKFETKSGKGGQYVTPRIHPDDPRAVGQVVPELRFETKDGGRPQTSMALYESQIEALKENSESFPLTDKDGNVVGTNYVTRADLQVAGQRPNSYLMPNSKTFQADPSLSAEPDVLDRSFELRAEAKAARNAAKEAKDAPEAAVDDKAAKRSAAATKAAATRRANKAKAAEAAEVSADEPALG